MKKILMLSLLLSAIQAFSQEMISGVIKDEISGQPLPFASIGFRDSFIGTTSNEQGVFELKFPSSLSDREIVISYLGYQSFSFLPESSKSPMSIQLTPMVTRLEEVVILPMEPTDYLKRAINKIPQNYPNEPFLSTGYYREQIKENGAFLKLTESIFKSYYPDYQDTLKYQHQAVLYRQKKDVAKLSFMREEIEKAQNKEEREAKKEGKDYDEESIDEGIIESNFGGPDAILSQDIIKKHPDFLDSTKFKEFKYKFGGASTYQGRELLIIEFKSRGKLEHMKQVGKVYLDLHSDAIVAIDFEGKIVIPIIVQPVLFIIGFGIGAPYFKMKHRYQLVDGKWYPKNLQWGVDVKLTRRHMFSKNDKSQFNIAQVFTITEIQNEAIQPLDSGKVFDPNKDLEKQIYNEEAITWEEVNIIQPDL